MSKKLKEKRIELINDLIAITTVKDDLWQYHPNNPKKKNVVKEFDSLIEMYKKIEVEIEEVEQKIG